jgi:hypothetical protein
MKINFILESASNQKRKIVKEFGIFYNYFGFSVKQGNLNYLL